MQLEEGLAEAGGEGRGRLGDAALRAGELGGEAGEEVILRLLGREDAHGRQDAERVGGEEDHVVGGGAGGLAVDLLDDLFDVLDRVAHAGVLGDGLVGKVDLAFRVQRDVLEERVALDGVVDIGLGLGVEVDDLGVAAALEVEHALIVPAVLVVADQQALRVGGEGGLAGAGEAEEDGGVLALHVGVGGAVHRGDALQGQIVVHHGEHALLHLAAVPGVEDDLLAAGDVEDDGGLGVETQLLVVLDLRLGRGVDDEVRLEALLLLGGGLDEHVADKVRLPGDLHDEADGHAGVLVRAAERIDHIELLAGEGLLRDRLDGGPGLLAGGVVVVLIFVARPPDGVLAVLVHDDELVLGGTAGVDAGHDVDGAKLADLALVKALQLGLHLFLEEQLIRGIVDDFSGVGNAVFGQIDLCHASDLLCFWVLPIISNLHLFNSKSKGIIVNKKTK